MGALPIVLVLVAACERASERDPPKPPPKPPEPVEAIDIVIAIDLSKSMEETDLPPDRLGATQNALRKFVAASGRDRLGIVLYARDVRRLAELTTDTKSIDRAIAKLQIGDVDELGTAIGDGLAEAVDELRPSTAKHKVVLLVGDGDNNSVTHFGPDQAAALARQAGVTVYTFLSGAENPDGFTMATNPKTFIDVAAATSGTFHRAPNVAAFDRGLAEVRAKLDAMKAPAGVPAP